MMHLALACGARAEHELRACEVAPGLLHFALVVLLWQCHDQQ